ncbi:hypothetical protein ISG27_12855 [Burkholderia pseudomallei]|nr:hypothetical protein [Burkholderia pseudomallei]MBF3975060.1 hypothetical protein [Burkholderia pseudomallei]
MGVNFYRSTDASAPTLTGQAGSLVSLLDACLVNGYGTQAAAGWTIAYTGTNKRDYKQGTGSNGFYLDVDDSGPGAGTYKDARARGYEAMTALATGTNAFPTTSQSATFGGVIRKSATADATARQWYLLADATCFYLFVDTGDLTNPSYSAAFAFGDFFSYKSGDTYNTMIIGRSAENTGSGAEQLPYITSPSQGVFTFSNYAGHYIARHWNAVGGAVAFGKQASVLCTGGGTNFVQMGDAYSQMNYPNGPDSALELSPLWVVHSNMIRGYMKGLWAPCHRQPLGHTDTFSGTGNMAGKTFMALNIANFTGSWNQFGGQIIIETSNTWS